jgi:NAD(P)-dependent dehydrogenase (short-subunit alcohol dehydrogenase family)
VFAGVRSQKDLRAELGPDAIALDVTSDASVAAAFAAIREKTDRIDVLVNNAGVVFVSTGLARMPMPCFGPYAASKAAVEALAEAFRYELMRRGGGGPRGRTGRDPVRGGRGRTTRSLPSNTRRCSRQGCS